MRRQLLDFVVCPECSGDLQSNVFLEEKGQVVDGQLSCSGCSRSYPVIGGVPRLLPDHLMNMVYSRYGDFFRTYAGALGSSSGPVRDASSVGEKKVQATQTTYSFQHTAWSYLQDQQHMLLTWKEFFFARIPVATDFFKGKVGLEAGCGEGRYLLVTSEYCDQIIGLDLSQGVDRAYARNLDRPNVNIVQGDIHHPPFRKEAFDFIYSTGVLHHLPTPKRGFDALIPLLKPKALIGVWVYNLTEANLLYRLSHLTVLHKLFRGLPQSVQVSLSYSLAATLEGSVFLPVRLASKIPVLRKRVPAQLREVASLPFHWKVKEVHDRTALPVINFISRDELSHWYTDNHLESVRITSQGRGLSGIGSK